MKIKIKAKGLRFKTDDPCLAIEVLKAHLNCPVKRILSKVKESFKEPKEPEVVSIGEVKYSMDKEAMDKLEKKVEQKKEDTNGSEEEVEQKTEKKNGRKIVMMNNWTLEEDKFIADRLDKKPSVLSKNKVLRKRHTAKAIRNRQSTWKNEKFERVGKDRADIMRAYLSGERVDTVVAEINKRKDDGTKKVAPKPIKFRDGRHAWSEEELETLKKNKNKSDEQIQKLIPNRSMQAILNKKRRLGYVKHRVINRTKWNDEQKRAVEENLNMPIKELVKIPELKDLTYAKIAAKQSSLKKLTENKGHEKSKNNQL